MARKQSVVIPVVNTDLTGILEKGCDFEGRLCFTGTFQINGKVKGKIFTTDTLIVGEFGSIDGEIEAGIVILSGEVKGTIKASCRVQMRTPAIFKGEIYTPSLSVEDGVIFQGHSKMVHEIDI